MAPPAALVFCAFNDPLDPLRTLEEGRQPKYLKRYLHDLGACGVVVEPVYFDRDYLSEHAAFYCTSVAGYSNSCRRVHYFSAKVGRPLFLAAAGGDAGATRQLQEAYLGFIVLRPIPGARLGRTVLRWYPERDHLRPRVIEPAREYACNVAGVELKVVGLAWQQQDVGVGACATIALWSMLHSSAFDDRHVIPTTAEVTQAAHGSGASVYRAFPSAGLQPHQLMVVLREKGFAPLVVAGDIKGVGFTKAHFASSLAALIRSGYPVLIAATAFKESDGLALEADGEHAVCAVGFRQAGSLAVPDPEEQLDDARTEYLYIHDDNLGPSVRFSIEPADNGVVHLRASTPKPLRPSTQPDSTAGYFILKPTLLLAAAHEEVRVSPEILRRHGLKLAAAITAVTAGSLPFVMSDRIVDRARYVRDELARILAERNQLLGRVRMDVWEKAPRMSAHVGLLRFGTAGTPLLDVLVDTSDSEINIRAFCHVVYDANLAATLASIDSDLTGEGLSIGTQIVAF